MINLMRFDNSVSWMDIIAIAGVGVALLSAYYGIGSQVDENAMQISNIHASLVRIEQKIVKDDESVVKQLDKLEAEVSEIRKESTVERRIINNKLDRLIENINLKK